MKLLTHRPRNSLSPFITPLAVSGLLLSAYWKWRQKKQELFNIEKEKTHRIKAEKKAHCHREFLLDATQELQIPLFSLHLQLQIINKLYLNGHADTNFKKLFQKNTAAALKQTEKLVSLVNTLLEVSGSNHHQNNLRLTESSMQEFLETVVHSFKNDNPSKEVPVEIEVPHNFSLLIDHERISQALKSLLSYMLRYGEGKKVSVKAVEEKKPTIYILSHTNHYTPEEHERFFKRFQRNILGRKGPGLGLEFSLAKEVLETQGAEVTLQSSPDNLGLEFVVSLSNSSSR